METIEFLTEVTLFKYLSSDALQQLATLMDIISFSEGQTIIKENDPADGFYVIRSGVTKVVKSAEEGEKEAVLAILHERDCFGEIGLIDNLPRSASVIAMRATECYFLPRDAFFVALGDYHEMAWGLLRALAAMVRSLERRWVAFLL